MRRAPGPGVASLALALALAPAAVAQTQAPEPIAVVPAIEAAGPATVRAVLDLDQQASDYNPRLRGGQLANPEEWPSSLYIEYPDAQGRVHPCTAALLGPRVLLTAAHCVPADGAGRLESRVQGEFHLACERHPNYASDPSADFALCRLSRSFVLPRGGRYETISGLPMSAVMDLRDDFIVLAGFGCTGDRIRDASSVEAAERPFRIGRTEIDETSASPSRRRGSAALYSNAQNYNLFTVEEDGLANLCPGDSGGPAFLSGREVRTRKIIGVSSRVLTRGLRFGGSLVSSTSGPAFRSWALRWLGASLEACGLQPGNLACR